MPVVRLRDYHDGKAPGAAQRCVVATVREMLIRYRASGGWRKQLRCDGTAATHVLAQHSILPRISEIGAFFSGSSSKSFGMSQQKHMPASLVIRGAKQLQLASGSLVLNRIEGQKKQTRADSSIRVG